MILQCFGEKLDKTQDLFKSSRRAIILNMKKGDKTIMKKKVFYQKWSKVVFASTWQIALKNPNNRFGSY